MFETLRARLRRPPSGDAGRVLIIDPGCLNGLGHHAGLDRVIAGHFVSEGRDVRTFVHKECDPDLVQNLSAEAVLFPSIYIGVPDNVDELTDRLGRRNERLYQELKAHVGQPKPGDQIIVHSITVWGLGGLAQWLEEAPTDHVSARIMLMFPPELDFVEVDKSLASDISTILSIAFNQAITRLKHGPAEIHWSTQSQAFTKHLAPLLGDNIQTLDLPVDFGQEAALPPNNPETVFLFPGAGRKEKGIGNLPGAIRWFLSGGGTGRFVVQAVDDDTIAHELRSLPNVEILNRHLSTRDYNEQMERADAVIVAYDPARYGHRAGHVVIEALGHGRPVIVTKGTWMDEIIADISPPCGTVAANYSAEALGAALLELDHNKRSFQENAQAAAPIIRDRHNPNTFLAAYLG